MKWLLALFVALLLMACRDNALVDLQDTPVMVQQVYLLPNSNADVFQYTPADSFFVEKNANYTFYVAHTVNGELQTDNDDIYSSILWNIDGHFYNIRSFRISFDSSGEKHGYVETVDLFGDTAHTDISIFVNEPSSISLDYPYDGYNQADRDDSKGVPLRWTVTGIDPWETATCTIYASDNRNAVSSSSMGTVNCNEQINLMGYTDSSELSSTIYWAVSARISSISGQATLITSDTYSFSNKISENVYSYIVIPISYKQARSDLSIHTDIAVISANGDTLGRVSNTKLENELTIPVPPQSGITIYATEALQSEYKSMPITIDVAKNTLMRLDTIKFTDQVPPQVAQASDIFGLTESIYFQLYDDGSGLNTNKIRVLMNGDTLVHSFNEPILAFNADCGGVCKIQVLGEDHAKNILPKQYWTLEKKNDALNLNGPFSSEAK